MPDGLDKMIERYEVWARHGEGGVGLPVGAEFIDYRWKADALYLMRRLVQSGVPISDAESQVKKEARVWIARHNVRRPRDINWARWDGCVDDAIETAVRLLLNPVDIATPKKKRTCLIKIKKNWSA